MKPNRNNELTTLAMQQRMAMMRRLTLLLMLLVTGCATRTVVREIPSDRYVVTVHAGVPFTPACDGKFVPQARFIEMLDAYIRESSRP